jgi:hypothetical protein
MGEAFEQWLLGRRVVHANTAPYLHQQAGHAERLNRTLCDRVRSMLREAGLSHKYWVEAMSTANYLRNRAPYADRDVTPLQALTGHIPDLSHLKSWGCKVWVHVPSELQKRKFAPRAMQGIFLGYNDSNPKAFIVGMDGGMVERGDVLFDDDPIDICVVTTSAEPTMDPYIAPPLAYLDRSKRPCKGRALGCKGNGVHGDKEVV